MTKELIFGKGALTDEQKNLSRKLTGVIVKEAKQLQQYTWVLIHYIPVENWMVDRTGTGLLCQKSKQKSWGRRSKN